MYVCMYVCVCVCDFSTKIVRFFLYLSHARDHRILKSHVTP